MERAPVIRRASVLVNEENGARYRRLVLDAPGADLPGQYVELREGEASAYFAIAAPPATAHLELLIAPRGELAQRLCALPVGALVSASGPMGPGFELARLRGREVVLFANGSGIAPIYALAAHLVQERLPLASLSVWYGDAGPASFAFADAWAELGAAVNLVASEPPAGWQGPTGFVQQAVASEASAWRPGATVLAVCGLPEMEAEVRALAAAAGLGEDDVLTNL